MDFLVMPVWLLSLALVGAFDPSLTCVWYVKSDAGGANDGSSWADAFVDLQDALAAANAGDEIWVATGTYRPDRGTGDRLMSFNLVCGVGLYGGFAGWETQRDQRDWLNNKSILSGDLLGDDGPRDCAEFSNCCYAHEGIGCDDPECEKLLCAIPLGNDPCCILGMPGGGWSEICASYARYSCCELGGWNACENTFDVVRTADCGEPSVLDGLSITGAYFSFLRDRAYSGIAYGSGLRVERSELLVANTEILGNAGYGVLMGDARITFDHCTVTNEFGSGVEGAGDVVFTDCFFLGNLGTAASIYGNAVYRRCLFDGNANTTPYGIYSVSCNRGLFVFDDCLITRASGWGIDARHASVAILNTTISDMSSAVVASDAAVLVRNSRVTGHLGSYTFYGSSSSVLIENTLFADNTSGPGDVIYVGSGSLDLRACTFARNLNSDGFGAKIGVSGAFSPTSLTISNSIIWLGDDIAVGSGLLSTYDQNTSMTVNHSIVQGWTGALGGEGNSGDDPMLADPVGPDGVAGSGDEDYRLSPDSPAINAGDPNFTPQSGETDLDGHARVLCGTVDIGAYEFGIGDFNCDQRIDIGDFSNWATCMTTPSPIAIRPGCEAFDFNADSDVDLSDFAAFEGLFAAP